MTTVLAVDLGGSKILACLVQNGEILEESRVATPRSGGVDAWMDAVGALAAPWAGRFALAGVAVTGLVQRGHWQALNPDTLPIPAGFLLEAELTRRLRVPITSLNDAQAAAWGEHVAGAGRGADDLVFVTISTGIGGGVILDGRLLQGRSGMAGSIGQIRLPAGRRLEEVASGSGIARLAAAEGQVVDAPALFAAHAAGAAFAGKVLDQAADATALLFRDLQYLYDPARIVVGGGVGLAPGHLERIRARLAHLSDVERPELVPAALGAHAGIIGITDLALREAAATREDQSL
jgi:N-acetylmannosamine-6-phosphate 2-epimerase / N-acetylmannosamine kinase